MESSLDRPAARSRDVVLIVEAVSMAIVAIAVVTGFLRLSLLSIPLALAAAAVYRRRHTRSSLVMAITCIILMSYAMIPYVRWLIT